MIVRVLSFRSISIVGTESTDWNAGVSPATSPTGDVSADVPEPLPLFRAEHSSAGETPAFQSVDCVAHG